MSVLEPRAAWLAGAGVVGVIGILARRWRQRTLERATGTRLPTGPEGIIRGAEPVRLGHGGHGVLLLHGFGDTPQSLGGLGLALHQRGWTVRIPLLAGHGRSLREFSRGRADDWVRGARAALDELRAECDRVSIVGQSMGGAIALLLASDVPTVATLVLLAPYLDMTGVAAWLGRTHRVASLFLPYLRSATPLSVREPAARRAALGFGVTTPRLLHELATVVHAARRCAGAVHTPTLMLQGGQDPRISRAVASSSFALLGGRPRELRWLPRSGHVIAVDLERDLVAADVIDWLGRYGAPPAAAGGGGVVEPS